MVVSRAKCSWVRVFCLGFRLPLDLVLMFGRDLERFGRGGRFVVLKASSKGRLRLAVGGGGEDERFEGGDEGRGALTREPYVRLTLVDIVGDRDYSTSASDATDSSTVM